MIFPVTELSARVGVDKLWPTGQFSSSPDFEDISQELC
jgi:hypothetical protein